MFEALLAAGYLCPPPAKFQLATIISLPNQKGMVTSWMNVWELECWEIALPAAFPELPAPPPPPPPPPPSRVHQNFLVWC